MPTSPNMPTNNPNIKFTITITQNSQNIPGNYSNVTVSVKYFHIVAGQSIIIPDGGGIYCTIDGSRYVGTVDPNQKINSDGKVLFSQNLKINHNSDGYKTLTCTVLTQVGSFWSDYHSYSQVLTKIPRASNFTISGSGNIGSISKITISRANSNFNHVLYYDVGSGRVSFASNVGTSYSWTIPEALYSKIPNSNSGSGTLYCETYVGSASNLVFETSYHDVHVAHNESTIDPTPNLVSETPYRETYRGTHDGSAVGPASNLVSETLYRDVRNAHNESTISPASNSSSETPYRDVHNAHDENTIDPTPNPDFKTPYREAYGARNESTIREARNESTYADSTANSSPETPHRETYDARNESAYVGSTSQTFSFYADVKASSPAFLDSQLSYYDNDSSVVAITGNNQWIVQNKSNLQVGFSAAVPKNAATISSYQITFNGKTITRNLPETIDYGTVNLETNSYIKIKAIDSRGNSTTISKEVTCFSWQPPTATITASRKNNFENESYLTVNALISSVNGTNSIKTLQYRNKKANDDNYSDWIDIESGIKTTISIDNAFAWNFQVQLFDQFDTNSYCNFTIAKGIPILFFDTQKISVGVNKFPVNNNSFDVDTLNGNPVLNYEVISVWDDPASYLIDFNDSYYFTNSGGVFTSNNYHVASTTAYTRLKIDTTGRYGDSYVTINYTISSESGYDFGYVTANNSSLFPPYNQTDGQFIYVSGSSTSNSSYYLTKGLIWYIHLGYRKDSGVDSNNDTFTINQITLT